MNARRSIYTLPPTRRKTVPATPHSPVSAILSHRLDRLPGRSIFAKQLVLYILIILLLSGVIGFLFFSTARQHLEGEVGSKLQSIALASRPCGARSSMTPDIAITKKVKEMP